ncbi:MAG: TRAP transporter small permease [Pseudomonadota bacterium]
MSDSKPKITSFYDKVLNAICQASLLVSGVAMVVLTVIFGWLVFGRYVLNATPTWVEQVSLLLVMLIGFLGASVGIHQNTHLGVSYFREVSPRPVRRVFEFVSHVVLMVFGAVMMVKSFELVVFKWTTDIPLINVPEGLRAIPITLCGAFTCMYSIGHLIHFFGNSSAAQSDNNEQ